MSANRANTRTAVVMAGVALGMLGLAFAAVPLYRVFCEATGYGGTTQRAVVAPAHAGERVITVRFNAEIDSVNLPWTFEPAQNEVQVRVGEQHLVFYRAHNKTGIPVTGRATFNVTPSKAGLYFDKIACFCFTAQTLDPGQTADMPVSFFIDPKIVEDRNLDDVSTITLSYTFFRANADGAASPRAGSGGTLSQAPSPSPAVN